MADPEKKGSRSNSTSTTNSPHPLRDDSIDVAPGERFQPPETDERDYLDRAATSVSRRSTSTTSRANNALSTIRSRRPFPPFAHVLGHTKTGPDVIVEFDGPDDPYSPLNWNLRKKVITTGLYGFITLGATFASSVYSPAVEQIAQDFHVGLEVSKLGLSTLLLGFGCGPLVWAPLSEVFGRKPAVLAPYFIAAIFSFATAAAKDIQTVVISRFFAGFFSAAPITNTGGVLGDIWSNEQRGAALVGYAIAVVGGPCLGPLIGGAIVESSLRWRWTEYVTGIYMLFILAMGVLLLDETYPPVLLVYKARRLRHETGNWALHAEHEEWDVSIEELGRKYLVRPFQMLFTPICFLISLYAAFVYALLYANLGAFPVAFQEVRGWNPVIGALPFISLLLGICFGGVANVANQKFYVRRYHKNENRAVPEARLPPMMIGSVVYSVGLFVFAWTSDPKIHWIAPNIGLVCVGFGFFTIFQASLNYLIDTFQRYAASAIAATTFLRSMLAAAFPLFIQQQLHAMGVDWGISVYAFFAILMIPVPFLFYTFGKRIRARGTYSRASV